MRPIDGDVLIQKASCEAEGMTEPFKSQFGVLVEWLVDKTPIIEPEPHWILCSEKLPEDQTEVFVYLFDRQGPYIAWIEDTRWYTEEFAIDRENEPIAWMPLPKPPTVWT